MRRVAILQARMTSRRLPGKVLMDLVGQPMIARQIERLRRCNRLDEIVLATTTNDQDNELVRLAERIDLRWYRGSEDDVLARFLGAAREAAAEMVVRVTADCPLIDPEQSDRVIAALEDQRADYASNVGRRTFPRGLDTEVFHLDTLARLDRLAHSTPAREHVTWYLRQERPDLFLALSIEDEEDHSDLRWTVDTAADLAFVRTLWERLELANRIVPYREILAHLRANPDLSRTEAAADKESRS
jgi:spore coat polysaccharide biosynthesis protein SpsF